MASVTWPPRVVAAPSSSSVKVVRARRGTAAARRPTSVVRSGGTAVAVVGIGRTGGGRRADARLDTALNRHHPPRRVPLRQPRHAHHAGHVPVNFSQAGCIPTLFSSKITPSPDAPPIALAFVIIEARPVHLPM